MCWEDFSTHFGNVDICNRSQGVDDMQLDHNEEQGCLGPARGCAWGCCKFWALCHGARKVYGGMRHRTSDATLPAEEFFDDGLHRTLKRFCSKTLGLGAA